MLFSALLTTVSAVLYGACFPPLSLAPLVWIALVPFFVAITRHGPAGAALLGLLWGTGIGVATGTWFPGMVSGYFEQPVWIGWASLPAVSAAHAGIYCAAFAGWVAWLAPRRLASPWVVALAWCGYELVRARAFGGDPWVLSGYALVHWPAFVQVADLAGPYAPGALVAAVNALLAACLVPALRGRHPARSFVTVPLTLGLALGYGWWRLGPSSDSAALPIAVVQSAVGRGLRWRSEYRERGLAEHLSLSREAMATHPVLVVWPEYAVSFYPQELTVEREKLIDGTRALAADVVLGAPHYEFTPAGRTVYHNSIFVLRGGRMAGRYDKRRLVPFAETTGDTAYTPGAGPAVLPSNAGRLGMLLCFEAMSPELARETVAAGAQVLVNLSNDSWFGSEAAARHHLEIATMRAVENRRWLVRAATTGYSAIVDPGGRMRAVSAFDRPAVLHAAVAPSDVVTVYQRVGDVPLAIAVVLAVVGALWVGRRRERLLQPEQEPSGPGTPI